MMGRFALTESMGRYSLPKQLDNIINWKVKIKETHIKYNTINKERNKVSTIQKNHYHIPPITTHSHKHHPHSTSSSSSLFTDWNGLDLSVIMNSKSYDSVSLCFSRSCQWDPPMHRYILSSIPSHSSLSILQHYPIARTHRFCSVHAIHCSNPLWTVIMFESTSSYWCTGMTLSSTHRSLLLWPFFAHYPLKKQADVYTM